MSVAAEARMPVLPTAVERRPWLLPRTRDISKIEFEPGYRKLKARLQEAIRGAADVDKAVRQTWAHSFREFDAWAAELGIRPRGRGVDPTVTRFMADEVRAEPMVAAPVVLGVVMADPQSEPEGLAGRLVQTPPHGSRAIRILALQAIGFANRPAYVPLLEQVVAEPKPFCTWAVLALGRMDGGARAIDRAIARLGDLGPLSRAIATALIISPDSDDVLAILSRLETSGRPGGAEIAERVADERAAAEGQPEDQGVPRELRARTVQTAGGHGLLSGAGRPQ